MKIFVNDEKFNVVDANNNFVGYELRPICCEQFGWFISDRECEEVQGNDYSDNLENYVFDTSFFKKVPFTTNKGFDKEEGGIVIFKLQSKDKEAYLHLYNHHNGYYSHGVTAQMGVAKIEDEL